MTSSPSPNGANGRDGRGRFSKGNAGGPGNPFAHRVGQWRAMIVTNVSEKDMADIIRALVAAAKAGESWAIREILDRTIGKPVEADLIARLEALEAQITPKENTE